ncbi:MAG: TetR/AcrR family transcriptional regulator [Bradyrhizobium sp.]|nr:TetR/AcrR family transcriptional regulator [Bradyrhizobium sp.]
MSPRDRILDAAMTVFRRHGFRRSSIEETAEAAGLTRQALYHHFKSKEALFRAVIERVHDGALADGAAAVERAEAAGKGLADILVAQIAARLHAFVASFDGSPHVEELFSEHLNHARDLYQHYAALHDAQVAATIERAIKRQKLTLASGMTAAKLARYVELAVTGTKSAYPSMRPADAFLRDAEAMLRMLIAGAIAPSKPKNPSPSARPVRRKAGARK